MQDVSASFVSVQIVMGPVILRLTWINWQNSIIPLIPGRVAIPKCLNSCCHEDLMGLACVHLHLTFTHVCTFPNQGTFNVGLNEA